MPRYLLDTHVIFDIGVHGDLKGLSAKVRPIIEDSNIELLLSVASEVEIAIKSGLGKIALSREELGQIYRRTLITSYPIRREHADRLFDLPLHHKDPFDRLIISTALTDNIPVITRDRQFRKYRGLQVVW